MTGSLAGRYSPRGARPTGGEPTVNRSELLELEETWSRIAEVGRLDGHAVGVCSPCGERTSVAVEPPISRGPRKGEQRSPWPECRYCHAGRVIPSPVALEDVTPRVRPRIPRAPVEQDTRVRLPWPGVDDVERPTYDPPMSDTPDPLAPDEPNVPPDEDPPEEPAPT